MHLNRIKFYFILQNLHENRMERSLEGCLKGRHNDLQWRVEGCHGGFAQALGDAVAGLSEAASDGGDGITVAANRDGIADGVLEVRRREECNGVIRRTALRME